MPNRFDPRPDEAYGRCLICDLELPTELVANEHMSETLEAAKTDAQGNARGHRVRVSNPTRAQRIEMEVSRIVDSAIDDAMNELDRLSGDATSKEIHTALGGNFEFQEAWEEHNNE